MATLKEEIKEMIDGLPEDASVEDIQYALYIRERVARGMREIDEGHFVSQEEAERRMREWIEK